MKKEYWDVTNQQAVEKAGEDLLEWTTILDAFKAIGKKSNDVVAHLQQEYDVPRYWARTLTTHLPEAAVKKALLFHKMI
ncbi:hypothetical protein AAEO56_17095 [Flavobacterium sp. DGU11]|uniref:Uncharacterized protein n=1 Tax=Flavobacterium arundinis TaxID=3139143 RepID=A0ABU9I232_9FLAO